MLLAPLCQTAVNNSSQLSIPLLKLSRLKGLQSVSPEVRHTLPVRRTLQAPMGGHLVRNRQRPAISVNRQPGTGALLSQS